MAVIKKTLARSIPSKVLALVLACGMALSSLALSAEKPLTPAIPGKKNQHHTETNLRFKLPFPKLCTLHDFFGKVG